MQNQFSESTSTQKKIIRRIWFWILIGLVAVGTLFFIMLPFGIDYGIERYLQSRGADQVTLEDVDFNPISGRMTLTNLAVTIGAQTVLKIPEATFKIEWTPFVRKRFVLERFTISDTQLIVEQLEDGNWRIGGITIPEKKEPSEPSSWNFSFQEASVINSKIELISARLKSDLVIERAKLLKLTSWLQDDSARLELTGQLNQAGMQLQLDVSPFGSDVAVSGRIKLTGLTLKPFSRLLQPHLKTLEGRLDLDVSIETRQTADGGINHHQKGPLKLHQIHTQIADMNLSKNDLAWDGAVRIEIPEDQEALKISADGRLNGSKLNLDIEKENFKLQQENFSWKGKIDYAQDKTSQKINTDGRISLVDLKMESPQLNLTEEELTWQGALEFSLNTKTGRQKIFANGRLDGASLAMTISNENIKLQQDNFGWKGKIDYAQDKNTQNIKTDGQISLVDFKMESPELNLAEEKLIWKGALQLSSTVKTEGQRVITDGALDGSHLQVSLPGRKLKFEHQGLSWKGRLDSGETNYFSSLQTEGDVTLKDIEILHSETNQRLLSTNRLDLQTIKIEGRNKINISDITLNGLALLADPKSAQSYVADPSPLRIQEARFKDVRLSQQKDLAIDVVQLTGVKGFLHRDRQGKWPAIDRLASIRSDVSSGDQTHRNTSDTRAKKKSDELGFRIGQIDIAGDSGLRFKDESVSPAFDMDLSILEARLAGLDSSQPQQPVSVKLLVSDKESARLSLDGTLQPFAEKVSLDWVAKIEALELPPLSPYVIQHTGFRFVSGEMQADIPVKINQNLLDGKIDLILYNPTVERVKKQAQQEEKQGKIGTSIPLDSALKLQRDKQNNVKLKIPISGDINDPKFSIADAINKVLVKSLQTSVLSYLKFVLGPYGIGLAVAEQAISGSAKIHLNPILFQPGSDVLDEAAIDYITRVAMIMREYPEVQVSVCGVATESDRAAETGDPGAKTGAQSTAQTDNADTALLALAERRSDQIQNQLVNAHGIAAKRIIGCKPKIAKGADAKPRVELHL